MKLLNLPETSTLTLIVREPSCRWVDDCPAAFLVHSCSNHIFFLSASSLVLESMPVLGQVFCLVKIDVSDLFAERTLHLVFLNTFRMLYHIQKVTYRVHLEGSVA